MTEPWCHENTLYYLLEHYTRGEGWLEVSRHSKREWALIARAGYLRDHPTVRPQDLRILHLALVDGAY